LKTDILGVGIDDLTLDEAVDRGAALMDAAGFHYAVTPNPEFILAARKDSRFRAVLNGADLAVADGVGVVYAARLLGRPLKEKVPGIDLAQALVRRMADSGKSLYLLGAKPGVAAQAAENLRLACPGLAICGVHDGYFRDSAPIVAQIKAAGADVLFVCLGAPKQEFWMAENGPACGVSLALGLGGSLDVFAGTAQRAPEKWQRLGLEWLYRLIRDPKRIARMAKLPLILVYALLNRAGGGKNG